MLYPFKTCLVSGLSVLFLGACTPTDFRRPGPLQQEDVYNALFPQWVELCAVSQISKKPGFGADISGGPGGHAVMFLHGACLDPLSPYPVLKTCNGGETGISMNAHFVNANWVGVAGRSFFFDGLLKPDDALTKISYNATKQESEKRGIYSAVSFRDWAMAERPSDITAEKWKYEISIGTDYAVSFGRARYCARLPITHEQLEQTVAFLNGRNASYQHGPRTFETNVLQDNCNHLTHNALAASGFWHDLPVHQFILHAALTFPVPKNEVVNLLDQAKRHKIDDLRALYRDKLTRQSLLQTGWLPGEPGIMLDSHPVKIPNEVYNTKLSLIFYDDPLLGHYHKAFEKYLADPSYHDLKANLLKYKALYKLIDNQRKPLSWWKGREPADFVLFYNAYYTWLHAQQALVEKGLTLLGSEASDASALSQAQTGTPPEEPALASGQQNLPPEEK